MCIGKREADVLTQRSKPSGRRGRGPGSGLAARAGELGEAGGIEARRERQSSEVAAAGGRGEKQPEPERRLLVWWERCERE